MISDYIRDNGASAVQEGDEFHFCSQDPTTYAEAKTTYTLGVKTSPTINVADGTGGGRSGVVSTFSDASTTGNGDATHWALVDTSNSRLLATGPLAGAPIAITTGAGETIALTSPVEIRIPD